MQDFNDYGFTLISEDDIPSYSSKGYLFRHKSGFEVYWLKNEDEERFFTYTIYTPPFDNSGVFHILEHTLLTGSERYRVRDPFMGMVRNSCNTFLNAMTGPDRTYYPAASPVKKDFDNIFKVYTDAVFNPLLRKESFMQEGIRMSNKGGLHFEGVVFSEMQGDISQHESVVASASARPLFDDDSPYEYEFGGNPPDIPTLTYEKFVETYKKHYVPANMTLFFYGDLEIEEYLKFLDNEYLKNRDPGARVPRAKLSSKWDKSKVYRAVSSGEESTAMVSWLLERAEDKKFATMLSLVVDILLGNPGSPLYKAIAESDLGTDLSSESGLSDSYREYIFSAGMTGIKEEDSDAIERYILSSLERIVDDGIEPRVIEAAIRRMEFKLKEIPSGLPQGYRLFFMHIDKGWAYGESPAHMLKSVEVLDEIKKENSERPRLFEDWIRDNLLNNTHRLLSIIVPSKNAEEAMEEKISSRLESLKDSYNAEDEKLFDEFENGEDSAEAISTLPRLSYLDLPNVANIIEHKRDGNIIYNTFRTGGIVYLDIAFDISDFTVEELEDAEFLSRLMGMCDVGELSYSQFLTELNYRTGGASFSIDCGSDKESGEFKAFFVIRVKVLEELIDDSYAMIEKAIKELRIDSDERVKAALVDIESDYKSTVLRSGHSYAISLAEASVSPSLYAQERLSGISYWLRTKELMSDVKGLEARLKVLLQHIFIKDRTTLHAAFEKSAEEKVLISSKAFLNTLQSSDEKSNTEIKSAPITKLYSASTPVSYSAIAAKAPEYGTLQHAKEKMFLSITSSNEIWALIREKGGAYGGGAMLDSNEDVMVFYTYRDPRLKESIEDFIKAIEEQEIADANIEDAKLAVLSRDVRPIAPSAKAYIDLRRCLYSISDEERLKTKDMQLSLSKEDIESARGDILLRLKKREIGAIASLSQLETIGAKEKIKKLPL